jgi:carbon storage regulator
MLVIRRRAGESLIISHDVEVEILEICGNQVKIGIQAPREVLVLRKEVQLTRAENHAASQPLSGPSLEAVRDRLLNATGLYRSNWLP